MIYPFIEGENVYDANKEGESDNKDTQKDDKKGCDKEDNKNKINENIDMKDLKEAIEKFTVKVISLKSELHVAKESLDNVSLVNYDSIKKWVIEEFFTGFKTQLMESLSNELDSDSQRLTNLLKLFLMIFKIRSLRTHRNNRIES